MVEAKKLIKLNSLYKYLALLFAAILLPFLFNDEYIRFLLVTICIYSILTLSLDIVVGRMGQITLGHSAFFALGAYASALVCLKLGAPVLVGWLAAIFITGILGLFIGFVALRTARGLTFSIITYGFSLLAWLILGGSYYFTGGWQGLTGIPAPTVNIPGILELSFKSNFSYYY